MINIINLDNFKNNDKIWVMGKEIDETNKHHYSKITMLTKDSIITNLDSRKSNILKISKLTYINLPNLININLSDNSLVKISDDIENLKLLKSLKLDNNNIAYLPISICKLVKLETLSLMGNQIKIIPTSIQNLTHLKVLKLSRNQLTVLPIEFGLLKSLECLFIDCNYFTSIPTTICYLKHLKELNFEWLEFSDPPFQKHLKEGMSQEVINLIKSNLQELIKAGVLFCNFSLFVEKNSQKKKDDEINKEILKKQMRKVSKVTKVSKLDQLEQSSEESDEEEESEEESVNIEPSNKRIIGTNQTDDFDEKLTNQNENINNRVISINSLIKINDFNNKETEKKYNIGSSSTIPKIILQNKKKYMRIFMCIENNYYGVMESLIKSDLEYLKVKNNDNRNALYLSIHLGKNDMVKLILSIYDILTISNNHIYLHKAIRMRNYFIVKLLLEIGIDPNKVDEQGSNALHICFNSFTKDFASCASIADEIIKRKISINHLNKESWGPIHIAARRSSIECIYWIIEKNNLLIQSNRDYFDFNLLGKSGWTPLHLSVNGYRFSETMLILSQNVDVMKSNTHGKIAKKVCSGNYLMTKLLQIQENIYFRKMFNIQVISSIKSNMRSPTTLITQQNYSQSLSNFFKKKPLETRDRKISQETINLNEDDYFIDKIDKQSTVNNIKEYPMSIKEDLKALNYHYEMIINDKISYAEKYDSIMKIKLLSIKEKKMLETSELTQVIRMILEDLDPKLQSSLILLSDILSIIIASKNYYLLPFLLDYKIHLEEFLRGDIEEREQLGQVTNNNTIPIVKFLINEITMSISLLHSIKVNSQDKDIKHLSNTVSRQKRKTQISNFGTITKKATSSIYKNNNESIFIEQVGHEIVNDNRSKYSNDSIFGDIQGTSNFLHGAFRIKSNSVKRDLENEDERLNENIDTKEDKSPLITFNRISNNISNANSPFNKAYEKKIHLTEDDEIE